MSAWQRSELSAAEFGRRHGINGQRLAWWRWHLASERARPVLAPVVVPSPPEPEPATDGAVEIHVAGKVLIVPAGFDEHALRRVLAVLEGAS